MSVKKNCTLVTITQDFIFRIERLDLCAKPANNRYVIVNYAAYSSEDNKNANAAVLTNSLDLRADAAEAVLTSSDKDALAAAYTELKKEGQLLYGGTDC